MAGSSLVRESDLAFMTRAGAEIGVASTKAFTTQLVGLAMLTLAIGKYNGLTAVQQQEMVAALRSLPVKLEQTLELAGSIEKLAEEFADKHNSLFLGRCDQYPIAMEGALKLKEISYIHAEAYAAGELKHGPLALIDAQMPIIVVAPNNELLEKLNYTLETIPQKGEIIYFSSSDVPRIFLLKKGNIKIVALDSNGNETIKDIIQKGDLFGELTLETDNKNEEYAKVLSDDVTICSFLMSDFEDLLLKNPTLALSYTKFVGLKMKRIKNSYANLISKDAKTRLYQFLKNWAEQEGSKNGNVVTIENYLTQNDIAQIICTSRQTATHLLNEMESNNLLSYKRKEIVIQDITKI